MKSLRGGQLLVEIHKLLRFSVLKIKWGSTEYNILSLRLVYKIEKNKYVSFGFTSKVGRFKFQIVSRENY